MPAESLPRMLVLGHVTCDRFGAEVRLGGAASYAARALALLGVETALVTVAPATSPLLDPLRAQPRLSLAVGNSDEMTTFEVSSVDGQRRLTVGAVARPLVLDDIPLAWRSVPAVYVGTVIGECDHGLLEKLAAASVTLGLQGSLRRIGERRSIVPAITLDLDHPPRAVRAAILSEADHPEAERIASSLAARGVVVALTRGDRGSTLFQARQRIEIAAAPAEELEATGAGDVFGAVFGYGLHLGRTPTEAAERAAWAAARVVEGPEMGRLARVAAELSEYW